MASTDELENRAWLLLDSAKGARGKTQQQLAQNAFGLLRRAGELRTVAAPGDQPAEEPGFRLFLSDAERKRTVWLLLPAVSLAEAIWAAQTLSSACAEVYGKFELWQGRSMAYEGEATDTVIPLEADKAIGPAAQQVVLEREEVLSRRDKALSRSRRLLDATEKLRRSLASPGAESDAAQTSTKETPAQKRDEARKR